MKIGVITFHCAYNCGALLQAYALQTVLEKLGCDVGLPNCNLVGLKRRFAALHSSRLGLRWLIDIYRIVKANAFSIGSVDLRRKYHRDFIKRFLKTEDVGLEWLEQSYDAFVFGSDQVWNPMCFLADNNPHGDKEIRLFFGESMSHKPCISYAASIGDRPLAENVRQRLAKSLARFSALSVRESLSGFGVCDKHGRSPVVVLDPTLLLTKNEWLRVASPKRMKRGEYILVYALDYSPFVLSCVRKASECLGLPVVMLAMNQYGLAGGPIASKMAFGPSDFIAGYRDCRAVIAQSFHGTALSVVFNKPFISLRNAVDEIESRPASLLRQIEASERIVNPASKEEDWLPLLKEGLSERSQKKLSEFRSSSIIWLRDAISAL